MDDDLQELHQFELNGPAQVNLKVKGTDKGLGLLRPIFGPKIRLKNENWLISIILYVLY